MVWLIVLAAYLWIVGGLVIARNFRNGIGGDTSDFVFMLLLWPVLVVLAYIRFIYEEMR